MFDIGWQELLMVAIVLILVVGPKDLPPMLRAFGRTVKKYRRVATDFKNQFNEALEESELDELRQTVKDVKAINPINKLKDVVDPLQQVGEEISTGLNDNPQAKAPVKAWKPNPEEISDAARAVGEKGKVVKAAPSLKTKAKTQTKTKTKTAKKTSTKASQGQHKTPKKAVIKKP